MQIAIFNTDISFFFFRYFQTQKGHVSSFTHRNKLEWISPLRFFNWFSLTFSFESKLLFLRELMNAIDILVTRLTVRSLKKNSFSISRRNTMAVHLYPFAKPNLKFQRVPIEKCLIVSRCVAWEFYTFLDAGSEVTLWRDLSNAESKFLANNEPIVMS